MKARLNAATRADWWLGAAVGLAALALYSQTLAPTVLQADGGEFQFVPWLPGIAHPTGYPLYVLLGWVWTHALPWGSVAWRMNLLSAMLAALAVSLTYAVTRQILAQTAAEAPTAGQRVIAAATAVTFAVTATFWSQAIIAEVYALHTLFVAAIIGLALNYGLQKKSVYSYLLALLFGLGLTHHITTILLLPALLVYLWLANRWAGPESSAFDKIKWLAAHAGLAALPLLLYLYLPLAAPNTPYATLHLSESQPLVLYENSLRGFVQHVTATVFTGEVRPAAVGAERLALTWQLLRQQIGWAGILLAGLGLVVLWQQRRDILALTGLGFIAIAGFNLIYFIGDVYVLFIPAWLLVCLWLGVGALSVAHGLARRFVQRKLGAPEESAVGYLTGRLKQNMLGLTTAGLSLFFFALPLTLLATQFDTVTQAANIEAEQRWQQILAEPLPPAAVLLSNDRNEMMPMWYYQYVEHRRPDLLGLFPLIVPDPAFATVGSVLDQALASGRPVYLIKPMDGLSLKANLSPAGTLVQATPLTGQPAIPLPNQIFASGDERIRLLGYDLAPTPAAPDAALTVTLYWQVMSPLSTDTTSTVQLLDGSDQRVAQSDHRPGGDYYPSHLWQPGEILRDQHQIQLPASILPGRLRLLVGLYSQPEPGVIVGLGSTSEIGAVTVD
ncbi:MAG: hypothetical protein FOGNACKC_02079 [Anaerolineae bacterium]|nr:hypothetical protein [Anaerolineae bacterium]